MFNKEMRLHMKSEKEQVKTCPMWTLKEKSDVDPAVIFPLFEWNHNTPIAIRRYEELQYSKEYCKIYVLNNEVISLSAVGDLPPTLSFFPPHRSFPSNTPKATHDVLARGVRQWQ